MVVTETLHLAVPLQKHRIARSLSEAVLGRLVGMLPYKAARLSGIALGGRSWACPSCEAVLDRDGNAAENLR